MENNFNQQNNGQGFGVASLVIGLVAFLLSFIPCIGIIAVFIGTAAIVFGAVSIAKANSASGSKGLGIAGVSLGTVALVVSLLWVMFFIKLGTKANIEEKIQSFFEWTDNQSQIDEPTDDMKSLDDLENALDELEGVRQEVEKAMNDSTKEMQQEVKKALEEAQKEIENAKEVKERHHKKEK
jgi:predicted PurR-regulated permease PerM